MDQPSHAAKHSPSLAKASSRVAALALFGLYLTIIAAFIAVKLSYPTFDQEREFRDSLSYTSAAEIPITSISFWAGERSFTVPLMLKLLGVSAQNFKLPMVLAQVRRFQTWLSIMCWLLLALTVANSLRNRWLKLLGFGVILFFSASYEISQWDMHLLSESISFSLFALLLAAWIFWLSLPPVRFKSLFGFAVLAGVVVITVLYSFVRDSNPYFVVMAAGIMAIAALVFKTMKTRRMVVWIYFAVAIGVFFAQYASINIGNRWEIMIYDHLKAWILPNPEPLDFFVKAGLPVSDELLKISQERGGIYQSLILHDPALEPVRQWTKAYGKATYLRYLLTHPRSTFWTPLGVASVLLDGTGQFYRMPRSPEQPIPSGITTLTQIVYPILPKRLYAALWALVVGLSGVLLWRGRANPAWLVVAILFIPIYPLLVLVWNVNPIETSRHAEQIAIQLRLGGWMALILGLDLIWKKKASLLPGKGGQME